MSVVCGVMVWCGVSCDVVCYGVVCCGVVYLLRGAWLSCAVLVVLVLCAVLRLHSRSPQVDLVLVGAEGVVESGGIINQVCLLRFP